jgi:hypothetical protein
MKNYRFYNWACNWVFQLQWTFATHGIHMALTVNKQVTTVTTNTLCCIQYHIYGAIHMQLFCN